MKPNFPQVCLYQPEIPQNTGTIGRLCAATQTRLHLIEPFGFTTDDRNLLRPGLDYWPYLDVEIHKNLEELLEQFGPDEVAFCSTKATAVYTEIPARVKLLIFGRETSGFPQEIYDRYQDRLFKIPMLHENVRSLNLANAVSIVLYAHMQKLACF